MKLAVPSSFELSSDRAAAAGGCITGVLRRIVCRSVRETRCEDADSERLQGVQGKKMEGAPAPAAGVGPGIVARLMGLESSAAVFPCVQPEIISRTRSANSVEERCVNGGSQLRKSQSFREIPSYLRKESEEFLVLTFGDFDEFKATEVNGKKMDLGAEHRNMKERRSPEKRRQGKKPPEFDAETSSSSLEKGEMEERCRKKISFTQGEMEMECSSQNSSPVSVFDLPLHAEIEHLVVPDSSVSVCKVSIGELKEEESGRKIVSEVEDENEKASRKFSDVWARICRIGEADMTKSDWFTKKMGKSEEKDEIGFVIGHVILDHLLHEVVFEMWK